MEWKEDPDDTLSMGSQDENGEVFFDAREDDETFDPAVHWANLMKKGRVHIVDEEQAPVKQSYLPQEFVPYDVVESENPVECPYHLFYFATELIYEFINLDMFANLGVESMRQVLLRKCKEIKCDDILTLDFIVPVLRPPCHKSGTNGLVKLVHAPALPQIFYAVFKQDKHQIELIQRYLTMEVEHNNLLAFDRIAFPSIGDIVACLNSSKGLYERAEVLGPLHLFKETIQILYIDNGKTCEVPLSWLRVIPLGLESIPAYAFKCTLGVEYEYGWDDNMVFAIEEFLKTSIAGSKILGIQRKSVLRCTIICHDEMEKMSLVNLELAFKKPIRDNRLGPPDQAVNITEEIEKGKRVIASIWRSHEQIAAKQKNRMLSDPWRNYINESFKFPINYVLKFRITWIENTEFLWVEHVPCTNWRRIAPWAIEFENEEYRDKFRLVGNPVINRYYAWICPKTRVAERVKILSYNPDTSAIRIRLIDSGVLTRLNLSDKHTLYELERRFCLTPVTGFRAYLKHVLVQPEFEHTYKEFLRDASDNVIFDGIVSDHKRHFKDQEPLLGLLLINPFFKLTLNASIVEQGFGTSTGILSWPYNFVNVPNNEIDQEKVAEDLQLQFPEVNLERAKPVALPFVYQLPKKIRLHLPQVFITSLTSPSWVVMQPAYLKEFLDTMEANMFKIAEHIPIKFKYETYELVMVLMEIPELKLGLKWYRGIVRAVINSVELTKGVLVDYGTEFSVKPQCIRPLPYAYHNVPGVCFRAHFDVKGVIPLGGTKNQWTSSSADFLRRYIVAWAGKIPSYYAYRPNVVEGIKFSNYRQPLHYNTTSNKWEPQPGNWDDGDPLTKIKNHPLIKQFYVSYGMDLWYEIWYHGRGYRFERLCDRLVDKNYAMFNPNV